MPHECTNCGETFADGSKEMLSGCPSCGGNKFQFRPSSASSTTAASDGTPSDGTSDSASGDSTRSDGTTDRGQSDVTAGNAPSTSPQGRSQSKPTDSSQPKSESRRPWPGEDTSTDRESGSPKPWPSTAREPSSRGQSNTTAESDVTVEPQRSADASTRRSRSPSPNDAPPEPHDGPPSETREDRAQADARSGTVSPDEISRAAPADAPQSADDAGEIDDKPDLSALREELNEQFESIKIVSPGQYELNLMELYDRDSYIISLQEDGHYVIEVPETWNRDDD
ncbi:OapC/ArvC family zinc-ribbon domain-containing protein [Haloprofundus salilacus]|uniref:OapC/ArvC family zinc-ribbon domain-containing protein n=1 Tax=Haloprofundus salilacus TaxID=2876190 RepID=UPI001CCCB475|nr:Zn-ribbon containing protein [Haloprofundus salilacus]